MSEQALILSYREDAIFILQFNRPDKKNAINKTMYLALTQAMQAAEADPDVRVIFIRGSEDCFTSGNDIKDFVNPAEMNGYDFIIDFLRTISTAEKPIVAAVGGLAVGIGTTLLLHCDLVYAAKDSYFLLPFVNLGLCLEAASSLLLPQRMGHQKAAELLLLCEPADAEKAYQLGLVNQVYNNDEYLSKAMEQAKLLASKPAEAVKITKRLIKAPYQQKAATAMNIEFEQFNQLLLGDECKAKMAKFLNKAK